MRITARHVVPGRLCSYFVLYHACGLPVIAEEVGSAALKGLDPGYYRREPRHILWSSGANPNQDAIQRGLRILISLVVLPLVAVCHDSLRTITFPTGLHRREHVLACELDPRMMLGPGLIGSCGQQDLDPSTDINAAE